MYVISKKNYYNSQIDYMNQIRRTFTKIASIINALDMTQLHPSFISPRQINKSTAGGIFFILSIGLIFIFFRQNFLSFFSFNDIKYQRTQSMSDPNRVLIFNKSQLILAGSVIVSQATRFQEIWFFSNFNNSTIQMEIQQIDKLQNIRELNLYFGYDTSQKLRQYMLKYPFTRCSPPELNFQLKGRYDQNFSMFGISFQQCFQQNCMTIQQLTQYQQTVYFNYLIPRVIFNPLKLNPITYYLDDSIFVQANSNAYSYFNVYLKQVIYNDREINIVPSNFDFFKQNISSKFGEYEVIIDTKQSKKGVFSSIIFIKSKILVTYKRQIVKIDQFLSNVAIFLNFYFILATIIIVPYKQARMKYLLYKKILDRPQQMQKLSYFRFLKQKLMLTLIPNYESQIEQCIKKMQKILSINSYLQIVSSSDLNFQSQNIIQQQSQNKSDSKQQGGQKKQQIDAQEDVQNHGTAKPVLRMLSNYVQEIKIMDSNEWGDQT